MKIPSNVSKGEKATAEWANSVVNALRSLQPCPSADIGFVQTPNGWTAFLVNKPVYYRPPRIWKVNLAELQLDPITLLFRVLKSVSSEIVAAVSNPSVFYDAIIGYFNDFIDVIMNPDYDGDGEFTTSDISAQIDAIVDNILLPIIDGIDNKVEVVCGDALPISNALSEYFSSQLPQNGDYIYTDELGLCYTIFQEDKENNCPTPNLIFRVRFSIAGVNYYALTLFPFPDIAECAKTLLESIVGWIKSFISSSIQGLVNAILDMANGIIKKALNLKEILDTAMKAADAALEASMQMLEQFATDANAIANDALRRVGSAMESITDLTTRIDAFDSLYESSMERMSENLNSLSTEQEDLSKRIENIEGDIDLKLQPFEEFKDNLKNITVLLHNGMSQIVQVSTTALPNNYAAFESVEMCENGVAVKKELLIKNGN